MIEDTNEAVVEETIVEENAEVAEAVQATEAPVSLTVQDLANLRNIIDVASQRGAFKTNEFTVVGATYSRLNDFINAITPAAPEEADTEAKAETAGE